jgi:hypothetical protein
VPARPCSAGLATRCGRTGAGGGRGHAGEGDALWAYGCRGRPRARWGGRRVVGVRVPGEAAGTLGGRRVVGGGVPGEAAGTLGRATPCGGRAPGEPHARWERRPRERRRGPASVCEGSVAVAAAGARQRRAEGDERAACTTRGPAAERAEIRNLSRPVVAGQDDHWAAPVARKRVPYRDADRRCPQAPHAVRRAGAAAHRPLPRDRCRLTALSELHYCAATSGDNVVNPLDRVREQVGSGSAARLRS